MSDDIDQEVLAFKRRWFRTVRWLYVLMMICYTAAAGAFIHEREWGQLAQIITLALGVTLVIWFTRAIARIKGEW